MTQDEVPSRFAVDFAGATLLGIYRVEKKIADGGMGSVWLAEDTNLGRRVVVKVPHVRFLGEPGFRARFAREIAELVRLEHPNIVGIMAQGTHEEVPFFVLQFLGGGSLEDWLKTAGAAPRGVDAVVPWLRTIAATLDSVHARGVVHRDVKPANVLFDEQGHVFLSDFGVVKALDEDANVTEAGTGIGSPRYMAPEQAFGRPFDGTADQYGLAVAVYEAIAGRLPFEGTSVLELLVNKRDQAPVPLAELAPDLPADCANAVMRGFAKEPRERFATCEDFADAFLAGAGIFDRTPASGVAALQGRRRTRVAAAGVLALLAVLTLTVGFAAGWFSSGSRSGGGGKAKGELDVVLLSSGAEPRRVLRYRLAPEAREITRVRIATRESKQIGDAEPKVVTLPGVATRFACEIREVDDDGAVTFGWKSLETTLTPARGTPEPYVAAIRSLAKSFQGRSGSARQSARGVSQHIANDTPPPEAEAAQPLFALMTELVKQVSTPLPEEPVGVGARWEVTHATNHMEGIRLTQTVIYEIESLEGDEAHLRIYVVVAALNQLLEHPDVPATANARLKRIHGDGEGALVIDLDRLGDRTLWMDVRSRAELSVSDEAGERDIKVSREMRIETEREP